MMPQVPGGFMFTRLDEVILACVERASRWLQVRYGLTCFWHARICHMLTLVIVAAVASRSPSPFWPFAAAAGSFAWMYATMVWGWYSQMDEHYAEFTGVAHPNTLQWREVHGAERMTMLAAIPCAVAYGLWNLSGPERLVIGFAAALVCWVAAQYLQCCIPLPPGAHRDYLQAKQEREALAAAAAAGAAAESA